MQNSENPVPKTQIKGPCCVCKETRQARDDCLQTRSEEECSGFIRAHFDCLKTFGFHADKKTQAQNSTSNN